MPRYTITADVTVYVKMTIEAEGENEARGIFDDQIMLNAGLTNLPESSFEVEEDSISEVDITKTERTS